MLSEIMETTIVIDYTYFSIKAVIRLIEKGQTKYAMNLLFMAQCKVCKFNKFIHGIDLH